MLVSIVIPLYNEHESLPELTRWINEVMSKNDLAYEVVYVDDGSTDGSWEVIENLKKEYTQIRALRFRRNYGKSAGLNRGFDAAEGDVIITMDADLQDSPEEIPELVRMITEEGFDLVSGWKKKRFDPITKTVPTKLYNWAARKMSGIYLHDFNCGLKAYRKDVIKSIEVYGEMHRYIPVIAKWAGFIKIGEKVVQHQERKFGVTKFGIERFINGPLDLLVITFMSRFGKRPMHFFGVYGTLMFLLGGAVSTWLILEKVIAIANQTKVREVTDQPLFYLAILAMIIGTQLFMAGFLAEMIARSSSDRNNYQIAETID
ncbi:MAG: glycosyltransferase family 2 protein [Flavobacteriales bacterium]|nr:glycosyltransferase family 2 protein [Flavobacteriales bacterium]MCB9203441.1 glycosyltransferase family 2 protein [Flavobacteriales bacterium]